MVKPSVHLTHSWHIATLDRALFSGIKQDRPSLSPNVQLQLKCYTLYICNRMTTSNCARFCGIVWEVCIITLLCFHSTLSACISSLVSLFIYKDTLVFCCFLLCSLIRWTYIIIIRQQHEYYQVTLAKTVLNISSKAGVKLKSDVLDWG